MGFKDGYETVIGERGVTLSGGQRQRLAIARALLTDPRILILDDSTSAIDSATEDEIQKAIRRLLEGRTTLLITHRLSQIRWADQILVLQRRRAASTRARTRSCWPAATSTAASSAATTGYEAADRRARRRGRDGGRRRP